MTTIYVKPREGGRVRQPERNNRVMPGAGDHVPRNGYYERLLIGGDVEEAEPSKAPAPDIEPDASAAAVGKPDAAPAPVLPAPKL